MTIWDLFSACGRRWSVVLVGLLATAAFAGIVVIRAPGVYWAQVDVVFLAPASQRYPNPLATTSGSLIMTAGIVLNKVTAGEEIPATSSAAVTLADQGILQGSMIRLPNSGGQWVNNFERPVLDVQAAGSTPEIVLAEMNAAISRINSALVDQQEAAGVSEINRIYTQSSPTLAQIQYLPGKRTRALLASVVLGLGITLAAVVYTDTRWPGPKRLRRH